MQSLITLDQVTLAFGLQPLLNKIKLQVNQGERVCLIGRNGEGKSSLLKIIEGTLLPDAGIIWRKPNLRVARLSQTLPQDSALRVYDFVAQGLKETGDLLSAYHLHLETLATSHTEKQLAYLSDLQKRMDANNAWQYEQSIKETLMRLGLDAEKPLSSLSGGWQRRAALAQALVSAPELLLLDEPTNHLDIETITWLEEQLLSSHTALLFITHDRALLQRIATRIIEIDRGELISWQCDYQSYLIRKEALLQTEAKSYVDFDKKLAQEERWIRQGIKARRTRNEGRVRELKALREVRLQRREMKENASFNLNEAMKSGDLVIDAQHISYKINQQLIINDFSMRIMRGDKIGLVGPNGAGKTTLLHLLLGKLVPTAGQVIQGTKLAVAYFDQLREVLDMEKSVLENVAQGTEIIEIKGKQQHIISYLNNFLFSPARALTPVKALSGGECNRLLLAKLFSKPANLLVMDEPTNDLDIETLELLEELLHDFSGTILLVSHDRAFLDNVVTSTLVFNVHGEIKEYVGGYQNYLIQSQAKSESKIKSVHNEILSLSNQSKRKLSYKEKIELEKLPKKIEELEEIKTEMQQSIGKPDFYEQDQNKITIALEQFKKLELEIETTYARWDELEKLVNNLRETL